MHELRRNLNLEVADVLPADAPQARSVHPSRPFVPLLLIALKTPLWALASSSATETFLD